MAAATPSIGLLPSLLSASYTLLGGPEMGYPDFDGNGVSDVVMQHTGGFTYVYLMEDNGTGWLQIKDNGSIPGLLTPSYTTLGFPDLNGDGKSDVCYQHTGGFTYCYLLDGRTILGEGQVSGLLTPSYQSLGFHDLNGDGTSDHVIQHTGGFTYSFVIVPDGGTFVMTSAQGPTGSLLTTSYQTLGFPDLNGDHKADIVIQHSGGFTYAFLQNGTALIGQGSIPGLPTTSYVTLDFPDLNGDGYADHVVQHSGGFTYAFLLEPDGGTFVQQQAAGQVSGPPTTSYTWLGFPDLNCDCRGDIVYQHSGGFTLGFESGSDGFIGTATQHTLLSPPPGYANRPWARP